MFGMQEDGKLGSTSKRQSGELAARPFFAQRLKTQPCPLWELNDLGSGPAYALRSNVSGALICFRSANKQPAVAIGPGTGPIWEDFWAVCLWAEETRFLDAGAVIAVSSWLLLGPSGLSKGWQFGHSLAELLLAAIWAAQFQLRHFGNVA
jgi:hypothetical protein